MIPRENFWIIILFLLGILSTLGFYWVEHQQSKKLYAYGHYPDSIVVNFTLRNFDRNGVLLQILKGKKGFHYPDSESSDLFDLNLEAINPKTPSWFISSSMAQIADNKSLIYLPYAVHLEQAAYPKHFSSLIDTSSVTIFPDKKFLITSQAVHLFQPGLEIFAVGAEYNYDQQVLNLNHQVYAKYQPNRKNNL